MPTSVTNNSTISVITGYAAVAGAETGSDGALNGAAEYLVGTASGHASARKIWDGDLSDGLDSGLVAVSLNALPGGGTNGLAWTVSGGGTVPLYYSAASYGAISSVKVVAAATRAGAVVTLSQLVVKFYKNGVQTELIECGSVGVDLSDWSQDCAEQIMTITPTASDNTQVVVDANLQFTLQADQLNNPDDLFARIYVFA
jgi:hypothetical protein